jgi:hypothetical protein
MARFSDRVMLVRLLAQKNGDGSLRTYVMGMLYAVELADMKLRV